MSNKIYTPNAPEAIGPYSQAITAGNLVFTSGQIAINPASGAVEATTIEEQTHQVCKNLTAVLEAAGSSYEKAIKTTCFLADIQDFAAFNEVYAGYFTGNNLKPVNYKLEKRSKSHTCKYSRSVSAALFTCQKNFCASSSFWIRKNIVFFYNQSVSQRYHKEYTQKTAD